MSHSDIMAESGLRCFGAVSASISHELKNALAIINENAGLLEDLSRMAQNGRPLAPERLQVLAANVTRQVRRADALIKHMNQFAHSVDAPVACCDLEDVLSLAAALNSRMAAMKGGTLLLEPFAAPVRITARPFWIQNLIWRCLNELLERPDAEKQLHLNARKTPGAAVITFSPVDNLLTTPHIPGVLNLLKAVQAVDFQNRELQIVLPEDIFATRDTNSD